MEVGAEVCYRGVIQCPDHCCLHFFYHLDPHDLPQVKQEVCGCRKNKIWSPESGFNTQTTNGLLSS